MLASLIAILKFCTTQRLFTNYRRRGREGEGEKGMQLKMLEGRKCNKTFDRDVEESNQSDLVDASRDVHKLPLPSPT